MKASVYDEIDQILAPLDENPKVQSMRNYVQHGSVSTYTHCRRVARKALAIKRFFRLHIDEKTLLYGAFLHDFYLYDWHQKGDGSHKWHGFHHADVAAKNAMDVFQIDKEVESIIRSHMFPLNLTKWPKSKAAWVVSLADKIISIKETIFRC